LPSSALPMLLQLLLGPALLAWLSGAEVPRLARLPQRVRTAAPAGAAVSRPQPMASAARGGPFGPGGLVVGNAALAPQPEPTDAQALLNLYESGSHALFLLLFEHSAQPVLLTDGCDRILSLNGSAAETLGYEAGDLCGRALEDIAAHTADAPDLEEIREHLGRAGEWRGNLWFRKRSGEPVSLRALRLPLRSADDRLLGYLTLGRDLTASAGEAHMSTWQAQHDPLTKLPNRTLFRERLSAALLGERGEKVAGAVLSLDLDRFKRVNESLGHQAGDQLLMQVAHRLALSIRDSDTVARIGSDEFAVIMAEAADVEAVETSARKLLEAMAEPFQVEDSECVISASLGVALFPIDGDAADELIRSADSAMHEAKSAGGGVCKFFESALNDEIARRLEIENRLRVAVRQEALELHYQPILSADGTTLVGAEALCRWHDADHGNVSPGEFIPVAEASGLIVPMGVWILEEASRQACRWRASGLPDFRVSVNVSNRQLQRPEDVDALLEAIERHDPAGLTIEITESLLMRDTDLTARFIEQARTLGARIALDDFGTGYSSLSYLRSYRIDTLKIDKSFVDHIESNNSDLSLVATIISMGRTLGMKTVAEGVENAQQVKYLQTLGCDYVQGYHFCRPLPRAEAERFFADHRAHRPDTDS
jgi:diguanylate cyclase (GGDEF)-like protein/PAS domain S-box-containing protein